MAHVQIPAREDVEPGVVHHSGITQAISITGEGCDVEQVNSNAFVIRVTQPVYDAFTTITDLSPLYDALQNLELLVAQQAEQSKELQEFVNNIHDVVPLQRFRIQSLEEIAARLQIDIDSLTANHVEARQKQTYVLLAALMTMMFSLLAVGIALWTLKV